MSFGMMIMAAFNNGPSGPTVSPSSASVTRLGSLNPTYAGVSYAATGIEYENPATGANSYTVSRGNWLDSGNASDVWMERSISAGSLNASDPGAGRHNMGTTRTLAVSDSTIPGGAVTCTYTISFYDAATGGNLLGSATVSLSAQREAGG